MNNTEGRTNIELKINPSVMGRMLNPLPMDFYEAYLGERKRAEAEHDRVVELTNRIKAKQIPHVKRILKNGDYMTVLWEDGDKTIVKRAEDEAESDYAAFTAALGIKCYGSNSALKRLVASAEVQGKKKKKQKEESPLKPIADKLSKICEVMVEANREEKK